jgi:hypothetical protein
MAVTLNHGSEANNVKASGISKTITAVKVKLTDTTDATKLFIRTGMDDLTSKVNVVYILTDSSNNVLLSGSILLSDTDYSRDTNTIFTKVATAIGVTIVA